MKVTERVVVVGLIMLALALGGGFYWGSQNAKSKSASSWQAGYNKGHTDGLAEVQPRISDDETRLSSITDKYNQLSDQYNQLRNAVIQYVGASTYQPSKHLSCTSNAIGSYTYTNCY